MSSKIFEQFRTLVLNDVELQKPLYDIKDREEFVRRLLEMGEQQGLAFTRDDVEDALRNGRRTWIERAI